MAEKKEAFALAIDQALRMIPLALAVRIYERA